MTLCPSRHHKTATAIACLVCVLGVCATVGLTRFVVFFAGHDIDEAWALRATSALASGVTGLHLHIQALRVVATTFIERATTPMSEAAFEKVFATTSNIGLDSGFVAALSVHPHVYEHERAEFEARLGGQIKLPPVLPGSLALSQPFPANYSREYYPITQIYPVPVKLRWHFTFLVDLRYRLPSRMQIISKSIATDSVQAEGPFMTPEMPDLTLIPFYQPIPSANETDRAVEGYLTHWVVANELAQLFNVNTTAGKQDLVMIDTTDPDNPVDVIRIHQVTNCSMRLLDSTVIHVAGRSWYVAMGRSQCLWDDELNEPHLVRVVSSIGGTLTLIASVVAFLLYLRHKRRAQERLRARLAKGIHAAHTRLLRVMNHELRNPLTVVRAGIELAQGLMMEFATHSAGSEAHDVLGFAFRAVDTMQRSLDGMLDVQLVHDNNLQPRLAPVFVDSLLRDIRHHANSAIPSEIPLLVSASPDLPPRVQLDGARTIQLLVDMIYHTLPLCSESALHLQVDALEQEFLMFSLGPLSQEAAAVFDFKKNVDEAEYLPVLAVANRVEELGWTLPPIHNVSLVASSSTLHTASLRSSQSEDIIAPSHALVGARGPVMCLRLCMSLGGSIILHPMSESTHVAVVALPFILPPVVDDSSSQHSGASSTLDSAACSVVFSAPHAMPRGLPPSAQTTPLASPRGPDSHTTIALQRDTRETEAIRPPNTSPEAPRSGILPPFPNSSSQGRPRASGDRETPAVACLPGVTPDVRRCVGSTDADAGVDAEAKAKGGVTILNLGTGTGVSDLNPTPQRARRRRLVSSTPKPGLFKGSGLTVVVVDDEPMIRKMVSRQLTRLGVRSIELSDGDQLLPLLQSMEEEPTAVFLDIVMKRSDGIQVLCDLRTAHASMSSWHLLPVYAMTSNVESVERFRETGFDGMLGKPFYGHQVVACLRHCQKQRERLEKIGQTPEFLELPDHRRRNFLVTGDKKRRKKQPSRPGAAQAASTT